MFIVGIYSETENLICKIKFTAQCDPFKFDTRSLFIINYVSHRWNQWLSLLKSVTILWAQEMFVFVFQHIGTSWGAHMEIWKFEDLTCQKEDDIDG